VPAIPDVRPNRSGVGLGIMGIYLLIARRLGAFNAL
jgi:hypothetical protein